MKLMKATYRTSGHPIRSTILVAIAAALVTIALVVASSSKPAVAASSLVNGSFETGNLTGWSVDTTNGGYASASPGHSYLGCGLDGWCGHVRTIWPQEGSYFAALTARYQQSEARISQPFEASNGDKVSGWVFLSTDPWVGHSYDLGQVVIKSDSGTTVATPFKESVGSGGVDPYWNYWEYTFSGVTGTATFQIEARLQKSPSSTSEESSVMGVDNVKTLTFDTTAPDTSITSGPSGLTNNAAPTFTFSGSDNLTSTANLNYQHRVDGGAWSTPPSTSTTANLTGLSEGAHLFEARAVDEAGNVDTIPARRSFTVDTIPPTITSTVPTVNANEGVLPTTDVTATFSEDMRASSINTNTFKLFKQGSTTPLAATVSYPDSLPHTAKLDPTDSLRRGWTYKAVVTTGARDLAGNRLEWEDSWFFTVSK